MWHRLPPVVKLLTLAAGLFGFLKGVEHMNKKRVFISFAVEDRNIRDLLVGQSRNDNTPFEFIDMSVKEPWDNAWKTQCRARIKGCHGVIVLVTKNTIKGDGAHWEIRCAQEEGVPVMAMYVSDEHKGCSLPVELKSARIHDWSWPNINKFVSGL